MRKWMRERLQRRKQKSTEEKQAAPPPLQPAYFDAEAANESPEPASHEMETPTAEAEVQPAARSKPSDETEPVSPGEGKEAAGERARGSRRRRGGRGRGGRGREQAVAAAFTPAAAKGIIPDLPPDAAGAEAAEPSSEAGEETPAAVEASAIETEPEVEPVAAPQVPAVPVAVPTAPGRPPKGIVVLAIGLPGSGKSSWFKRHNVVALSSDMMRTLLFDDVREQRFQDLVFSNLRSMLKARLIAKRPMNYVDATNLTPQERQHWIKLAKDYNYEVHAVFFDVPLEVCIERHHRRDRVVPEEIMRRMAAKLKAPTFQEGFAKITVVRVKKKEDAKEDAVVPA